MHERKIAVQTFVSDNTDNQNRNATSETGCADFASCHADDKISVQDKLMRNEAIGPVKKHFLDLNNM